MPWPVFVVALQSMRVVQARERLGAVRVEIIGRAAAAGQADLLNDDRRHARLEG